MLNQYRALLLSSPIFAGIHPDELSAMLACVSARVKPCARGELLLLPGDDVPCVGVVLSGQLHIAKEDVYGHRVIIAQAGEGDIYGETFATAQTPSAVTVEAACDSTVLLLDFARVLKTCPSACEHHTRLIRNMVELIARKNMRLMDKLEVLSKHSLREKLLAYLSQLSQAQGSATVRSPMGRVALADYLGADRSALTREMGRMQSDGLITFERDTYTLLHIDF